MRNFSFDPKLLFDEIRRIKGAGLTQAEVDAINAVIEAPVALSEGDLSPHFTLAEMTASQTAARLGIRNVPPDEAVRALRLLCERVLEPVREHFGRPVIVTSGYRSPRVNTAAGGSKSSQHTKGEAADFTVPGVANIDVAQWIERNLNYDQLIYEFGETGWIHCSYSAHRMRNAELTAKKVGGRTKYLPGIVA